MRILTTILLALSCTLPACVEPEAPLTGEQELEGVVETGKAWPKDTLQVCWMANAIDVLPEETHVATLREVGEDAVIREWGRVGRIRFNGNWPRCDQAPNADIRIGRLDDTKAEFGRSDFGRAAEDTPDSEPTMEIRFSRAAGTCSRSPSALCKFDDEDDEVGTLFLPLDPVTFSHVLLHEFGHALGLRHEEAHPGNTSCSPEPLDGLLETELVDGEPMWEFSSTSIMNSCNIVAPRDTLGVADIQALHTLYPGPTVLFENANLRTADSFAQPRVLGPGTFTLATTPWLNTISSIAIPAGHRVRLCNNASPAVCQNFTLSVRTLSSTFDDRIASIEIMPLVIASSNVGYLAPNQELSGARNLPFGNLADNALSSIFAAPTRAPYLCTDRDGGGSCNFFFGGGAADGVRMPFSFDDNVSYVSVQPRVMTYTNRLFRGTTRQLPIGTWRANQSSGTFVADVEALAISGLEVRACTLEGTSSPAFPGTGAGDCRTYTSSVDLLEDPPGPLGPHGEIRFLQVKAPPVIGP